MLAAKHGAEMPYLVRSTAAGEDNITEAATANDAILAGERAEAEGRADVVITMPNGDSWSLVQFKVIIAGMKVESQYADRP